MNSTNEPEHDVEHVTDPGRAAQGERGSILLGVGLVAAGHVGACLAAAAIGALFGNSELGMAWFLFLGVTQLVHVVPLAVWTRSRGRERTTKGIWIGAGITALLAAACFGIALSMLG